MVLLCFGVSVHVKHKIKCLLKPPIKLINNGTAAKGDNSSNSNTTG